MDLANIIRAIGAEERIDLHDLWPEMPELARDPCLTAAQRFAIGVVGVSELLPEPAPRACEHPPDGRPQHLAGQEIAGALAVAGHADRNVDRGPIKRKGQRVCDIAMEGDPAMLTIQENGDPAFAEAIEAERPHPRF